ncbi:antirestriction protein [Pseudoduganella umbonata]|nr:antirestriction protein [Pseudoduganella umbonata]MBB3221668.1 hypothetical protein [Pseudoduganella umbonata]
MDCSNGNAVVERVVRAQRVGEAGRIDCLPRHFGVMGIVAEHATYGTLARLSENYRGGYWHYYELDNGGFYMAPDGDKPYLMIVEGNGYEGIVSPDAAGIIACAMVYSHLSFRWDGAQFVRAFHQLREFIFMHGEHTDILQALD